MTFLFVLNSRILPPPPTFLNVNSCVVHILKDLDAAVVGRENPQCSAKNTFSTVKFSLIALNECVTICRTNENVAKVISWRLNVDSTFVSNAALLMKTH